MSELHVFRDRAEAERYMEKLGFALDENNHIYPKDLPDGYPTYPVNSLPMPLGVLMNDRCLYLLNWNDPVASEYRECLRRELSEGSVQ